MKNISFFVIIALKNKKGEGKMLNESIVRAISTVGTVICLALIILKVAMLFFNLLRKRKISIPYIRNYKKGSFITNYLIMMLVYFIGILYAERNLFTAFSSSITCAMDFIVLRLNTGAIGMLMADSLLYSISVYTAYGLVVLGTVLLTVSLIHQYIWCAIQSFFLRITRRDRLYLLGYNKENVDIYLSDGKRRFKFLIASLTKDEREKLFIDGIPYFSSSPDEWLDSHLPEFLRTSLRRSVFVVNTGDDKQNIELCKRFVEAIDSASGDVREAMFSKLSIYVFGDPKYQAIYENMVKRGLGCINYINKYQKIAIDFIDRYPLTLFMNEEQIDYSTSLIREGVDINVALVGFGKTNQEILLTSVASNQFMTASASGALHKPIKYFIYDKNHAERNKNLNHNYYRLKQKMKNMNSEDYLPIPPLPAEEQYLHMDINDTCFYESIKKVVTNNPKDANFIVIAFGNDIENLDMAQKLVEKCKEWDLTNVTIFVRAFGWRKEQTPIEDENCYFFGNEKLTVFDIDKMLSDKLYSMARIRNEMLDLERAITYGNAKVDDAFVRNNSIKANERWYKTKSQMQRDSSIFACLSLRVKLNLMGLDYCEKTADGDPLSEEEYFSIYAKGDLPDIQTYNLRVNGKSIIHYGIDYPPSLRKNMAIQEHYRWTSFVISRGMVPATKQQILTEKRIKNGAEIHTNGKNYSLRRHGNLTTFDGLIEFRQMLARRDGQPEEVKDRLRFRYQILDDAYWLLTSNGYKIVKKISCRDKNCDILHGKPI